MSKCCYGVITLWCYLVNSGSDWGLDFFCRLCSCDTTTLGSPIIPGFSIGLSTNLSTNILASEFVLIIPNVSDGVCCLYSRNYVPGESKAFPNVDINVLSKTLILKIKHIYFYLFQKLVTFFILVLKSLKVSIKSNKHELIHERLLSFVNFIFTFFHMV
jgi:hypothetical protein